MKTDSTAQQLFHKLTHCWQPGPKRAVSPQHLASMVGKVVNSVDNAPRSTPAMRAQNALLEFVKAAERAQQDEAQPLSRELRKEAFKDMRVIQRGLRAESHKAGLDRGQPGSSNHSRYEELKHLTRQAREVKHLLKP